MIYRGPGFLVVVLFGSSPAPHSHQLVFFLFSLPLPSQVEFTNGEREGGRGAKSYDRENHLALYKPSIHSGYD
jgi:hypothetical protein